MKNFFLIVSLLLFYNIAFTQDMKLSKKELQNRLDSVLVEGNLLYKYEKAAWISTDLANQNLNVKDEMKGYFTYRINDTIKTIILGENFKNCISEYIFITDFEKPSISVVKREITLFESKLLEIKDKMAAQLLDEKYEIVMTKGYNPNLILLPFNNSYKLYMIMGTSQSEVIPFGNDYLFVADSNGIIQDWKKFHSRMIPMQTKVDGRKATAIIHSHLRSTPLITATDICTFMLYAPLYQLQEFSVYSPALNINMTYNLKSNKITTEKNKY